MTEVARLPDPGMEAWGAEPSPKGCAGAARAAIHRDVRKRMEWGTATPCSSFAELFFLGYGIETCAEHLTNSDSCSGRPTCWHATSCQARVGDPLDHPLAL